MLKLHMHAMHLCTKHNLVETVIVNVSRMFADTAERCFNYIRSLPQSKRPSLNLTISEYLFPVYKRLPRYCVRLLR